MIIKVLGSGCANCKKLERLVEKTTAQLGIEAQIVKVTDVAEILGYGVMSTPALVINEELVYSGQLPSPDQLSNIVEHARQRSC